MNNHSLQIGSILYTSWGYEQTNIDFYEVTRLIGKTTLELREISQSCVPGQYGLSGKTKPIPSHFVSDPFKKRISTEGSVRIDGHGAYIWSGEALNYSSYA
ncbi:hypothetical protein TUM19329_36020 (plasmid) [Legionella antarctica]|uniref:Uncharacterized protein n=1 Tax=Legionella antarctica TaxID=2708020 RepID=A0A6F8T9W3_9GAMM|nr:hypothetical protein [Legionella antarctica]BCA97241.1 hypothetical protein TUM19329_36020 [Legionella antarctica]